MVCFSDWRLRRVVSSARYRAVRRTLASTFSRGRPLPPRVSLLHMLLAPSPGFSHPSRLYPATMDRPKLRRALYGARGGVAGEGVLLVGGKAIRILPGVGDYAQLSLVYLDEVEARRSSGAETIRDGTGRRDDEAVGALLDGMDSRLV